MPENAKVDSIALEKAAQLEFKSMEKQGFISHVEESTGWCNGMVIVPKSKEKVCIYVDYTKLNKNVFHELHMLPTVEETL